MVGKLVVAWGDCAAGKSCKGFYGIFNLVSLAVTAMVPLVFGSWRSV